MSKRKMLLPEGKTCINCIYYKKCFALFGAYESRKDCDFFPNRFKEKENKGELKVE